MDCYLDVVGGVCLFDLKKADQRQSEIKYLAKASSKITELKQFM
jgi:hypothetical protein